MKRSLYTVTALLLLIPLLVITYLSWVTAWQYPQLVNSHYTTHNWSLLFNSNNQLASSLLLSILISSSIATIATAFGFVVSNSILLKKRSTFLLSLAYYPYLIAPVVFGAMLQFYFTWLGLTGSLAGIILAQLLFILPHSVLFLSTFWNDHIRQTAFQATSLGATSGQVYRTLLIPMAKPWLFICFAQCFLISWFEYGMTQLIGVGKVQTLTILTMQFIREANPHIAALAAILLVLPPLTLWVINRKIFLQQPVAS